MNQNEIEEKIENIPHSFDDNEDYTRLVFGLTLKDLVDQLVAIIVDSGYNVEYYGTGYTEPNNTDTEYAIVKINRNMDFLNMLNLLNLSNDISILNYDNCMKLFIYGTVEDIKGTKVNTLYINVVSLIHKINEFNFIVEELNDEKK